MAARTKKTTRKTAKKKVSRTTRRKASVSKLDRFPPTLREFSKQVRTRLNRLEQRIDRVQASYRKQVAQLIRMTSHRIDQAEPVRKQVIRLLSRLEKAIRPQTKRIR